MMAKQIKQTDVDSCMQDPVHVPGWAVKVRQRSQAAEGWRQDCGGGLATSAQSFSMCSAGMHQVLEGELL